MKLLISFLTLLLCASAQISPDAYKPLHWRSIGPYRAGRVSAVAGVPSQPNLYYIGTPAGGVWKTDDAGQTWHPISDSIPVSSIGAVSVSLSNPNIIYIGTGEFYASSNGTFRGNGVYKSTDAGQTWKNVGLSETHAITGISVDPQNPDVLLVAASGDPASADQRGIFKSINGGKDWKKVLFKDNDSGAVDLNMAPGNPKVVYASFIRRPNTPPGTPPPAPGTPRPQDGFIYRSTDEGSTWTQVPGKGLPTEPLGRVGIAAAAGSKGKTVYAIVSQGFFRSDDQGDTWRQTTKDPRVISNIYFGQIFADPTDANTVYVGQTSMYRTSDGGKTFASVFGAPSGDDYHLLWINPLKPQYMLAGVDQGAIVSVNKGATWSNWYNQPTGQFYHVTTDDRFPYYVYAAQQDSGTAAVASRSDFGEITDREWAPTGGFEFSFIAPDPINTNIVYIGGWYGSIVRFDRTTGQVNPIFVRTPKYRTAGMAPLAFSPQDKKTLYVGAQFVMRSADAGFTWTEISPDLTKVEPPPSTPAERGRNAGAVISAMALSTASEDLIWAGTSNGLVHVTRDGKSWQNVTPPGLPEHSNINELEASPNDPATAYVVVNAFRDPKPYIYRTHDFGKTWQPIVTGMSPEFIARVVREDPVRKGLLYGGTENAAYVSFDDGDHWQSLQLDLPVTPVRDIKVHGDDLVIATYGRSLYILDDVTPLRQLTAGIANASMHLFVPQKALRVRWDNNQDTPLPLETPGGENPPDGAIIDYYLKSPLTAAEAANMKLQVFDAHHNLVREYSSKPDDYDRAPKNVPDYWFDSPAALTNKPGINRFVWDLRYPTPRILRYSYFGQSLDFIEYTLADHTIPGKTPHEMPMGALAVPGEYTVELTVGGMKFTQPLSVALDPRVHVTNADLQSQLDVERNMSAQMATTYAGYNQLAALKSALEDRKKSLAPALPQTQPKSKPVSALRGCPTGACPELAARALFAGGNNFDRNTAVIDQDERGNIPMEGPEAFEAAFEAAQDPAPKPDVPSTPLSALEDQVNKLKDGTQKDPGFGPINRELTRLFSMISSGDGRPASALVDAVTESCSGLSSRFAGWKELPASIAAANSYLQEHKLQPLPALGDVPAPPPCANNAAKAVQ